MFQWTPEVMEEWWVWEQSGTCRLQGLMGNCPASLPVGGLLTGQEVWLGHVGEGPGNLPRGLGPRDWAVQL